MIQEKHWIIVPDRRTQQAKGIGRIIRSYDFDAGHIHKPIFHALRVVTAGANTVIGAAAAIGGDIRDGEAAFCLCVL